MFVSQTGPATGKDKVKKGGSYMCVKVNGINSFDSTELCRAQGIVGI